MTDFEEVYNTYFKDVYLYIKSISKSERIAQEITSDTFYRAMRSIDSFRGDCDVRVWLCKIARNCYYTYLRKNARLQSLDQTKDEDLIADADSPSDQIIKRDEVERINKILSKIGQVYREVFVLRVYAELGFKEIADIFGKNENWACVTYHRARKMIKDGLEARK